MAWRLFRRRSKKTSKLHVTGLCQGNSPVTGEYPAQSASNAENVPFDDVISNCCNLNFVIPNTLQWMVTWAIPIKCVWWIPINLVTDKLAYVRVITRVYCTYKQHQIYIYMHWFNFIFSPLWYWSLRPGMGVTKAPLVNFSVSKIFHLAKVPAIFFESLSYLTGMTAAAIPIKYERDIQYLTCV